MQAIRTSKKTIERDVAIGQEEMLNRVKMYTPTLVMVVIMGNIRLLQKPLTADGMGLP